MAFAYQHPQYAHLLTSGFTCPTYREELEWILTQFDHGPPDGDVLDIGAGAGVTAAAGGAGAVCKKSRFSAAKASVLFSAAAAAAAASRRLPASPFRH